MSPMVRRPLAIELGLLGFLQHGPLHGYQIYQQISGPAGLQIVWKLKQAHLYALLVKLEEAGLITGSVQPQKTRPARRIYELTKKGETTFSQWLTDPVDTPRQMRQEFHVKIYFARQAGLETLKVLLQSQRLVCQNWLNSQVSIAAKFGGVDQFAEQVCQYRIGQIQATLIWLNSVEQAMIEKFNPTT